ncbi:MAG: hypothetical protein QOG65_2445, partial [Actinomycetota bacterium]|nr:hypothetical protein [Actinomycetota bacterium]
MPVPAAGPEATPAAAAPVDPVDAPGAPVDAPAEIDVTRPAERDVPVANWTANTTPAVPEVAPEPAPAARPRIGIGSFADLRGATPAPAAASTAPVAPPVPTAADAAPTPTADPDRAA